MKLNGELREKGVATESEQADKLLTDNELAVVSGGSNNNLGIEIPNKLEVSKVKKVIAEKEVKSSVKLEESKEEIAPVSFLTLG